MRKAFLKTARETLETMKRQLLAEIQQDLKQGREASKDEGMDTYDLASEEHAQHLGIDGYQLKKLKSALFGKEGICSLSGEHAHCERDGDDDDTNDEIHHDRSPFVGFDLYHDLMGVISGHVRLDVTDNRARLISVRIVLIGLLSLEAIS